MPHYFDQQFWYGKTHFAFLNGAGDRAFSFTISVFFLLTLWDS